MARLGISALRQMCLRVGNALRAGVDVRRVWQMEEEYARPRWREAIRIVRRHVESGQPLARGMEAAGVFPPLVVQLAAVGEQTGKLDDVFLKLAEHYNQLLSLRRTFWLGIAWPLFELTVAVLVIAAVIWISGWLVAGAGGEPVDVLGWGLVGTRGAVTWLLLCGAVAGAVVLLVEAVRRGWLGPQPVVAAMRVPLLGRALEALALSRITWALALALDSGMDAIRSVQLAILSAHNPYYEAGLSRMIATLRANATFHESFAAAGLFPATFIQELEAAEIAGTTTESLHRLAREYEERARTAMWMLTGVATVAVIATIFAVLIFAIFSLFFRVYLTPIREALDMAGSGRL
jgi:type IV pilus assembly protein PilC